ncbi:ABC transporter permease [Alkalihalobacterium alkalinitrilicum]|uniref:ABC transporter permease n=1 Tax=Alkalihalobacterium alkalinitrilicum TaxID=427920 RepID=UPI000994AEC9|nr:ABC transporter permease [Alkalihalobacterium alkalinitrilicum]
MRSFVFGLSLFFLLVCMAVLSQLPFVPDPNAMNISNRFDHPSTTHWLGTDQFGRDIFSRILHASGIALAVSVGAVSIGMIIGCLLGAIAGSTKGIVSTLIMRTMDGMFSFPNLLLALTIVVALGVGAINALIAIALFNIPLFARLMYGFILEANEYGHVKAARTYGASRKRILFIHMIPSALPRIVIQVTTSMGGAILAEAALSFLGLGVQPPHPSWGNMLSESQSFLSMAPWYPVISGVAILIAVMGFNLMGDGLREMEGDAS